MCRCFFTLCRWACVITSLLAFLCGCSKVQGDEDDPALDKVAMHYERNLALCIRLLDSIASGDSDLEKHYISARDAFKRLEPMLAFADAENYSALNGPNLRKVEEESATDIKVKEPIGMQVLEEMIFGDSVDVAATPKVAQITSARLRLLANNVDISHFRNHHILWMIRNAFLRVSLIGVTGFDSPVLRRSLEESAIVYQVLMEYLDFYAPAFSNPRLRDDWREEIDTTIRDLQGDFDAFDRYAFLKRHTHRQMELWKRTVSDWSVTFPFEMAIQNGAEGLFTNETFNPSFFRESKYGPMNEGKIHLGERLFHDRNLSRGGTMSCSSCHKKDLAFTDGLRVAMGQKRNSPTLTYAGLQQQFFYDGRSGSLEGQVISVVTSTMEFHSDLKSLTRVVAEDPEYRPAFDSLYSSRLNDETIRDAIASYVWSLNYFDSKFDSNIEDREASLTASEILGFNLFMGKAKCGTCHFAPVFNGTVPPDFMETEMEMLGVPAADTAGADIDEDAGRYDFMKTTQRKYFFKTPTVRNSALTAPYMHNGVFKTLEQVIDFYDRGGGAGIGIDHPEQTLPADPLGLEAHEKRALIDFLKTLTDRSLSGKKRFVPGVTRG